MSDPYIQSPQSSQQPHYVSPPQSWAPPPRRPDHRKKRRGMAIVLAVLGVIVGFIGISGYLAGKSDPDTAGTGACVAREGGSGVRVVDCTDPDAAYKIVGRVPDKAQAQFNVNSQRICDPFPDAKSAYWKGESGGKGYVLCLAPVK